MSDKDYKELITQLGKQWESKKDLDKWIWDAGQIVTTYLQEYTKDTIDRIKGDHPHGVDEFYK